jgi:hypothetical protein
MMPQDITADLSDRLRRRGVKFDQAELEGFAASVGRKPASNNDIESQAKRSGTKAGCISFFNSPQDG